MSESTCFNISYKINKQSLKDIIIDIVIITIFIHILKDNVKFNK